MPSTTTVLAPVNINAERALFGQPTWVVVASSAGASSATATYTPTGLDVPRLFYVDLSYSAAPQVSTFQILDSATVIWQREISATAPFVNHFDFATKPLRGTAGQVLTAIASSAGGSVVSTICLMGDVVRNSQGT